MPNPMHPDMRFLMRAREVAGAPGTTVAEYRRFWNAYAAATATPAPADMAIHDRVLSTKPHPVPVRVYRPAGPPGSRPGLLYMHGGGFMLGDLESSNTTAWGFAAGTGAVVVSVDYRLAPEHPFPAAFVDSWAVLRWVAAHGIELGIDPTRLAVSGDSAGGNLSAALALAARDRGGPALCAQAVVYPWVGLPFTYPSYVENAAGPGLTLDSMHKFDKAYLTTEAARSDPMAKPILARSFAGLPPAFVHTAELDPIRDDGREYAARLAQAGTDVIYREVPGFIHGFLRARLHGATAQDEFARLCGFLRDRFSS
jgi:acetyl esterase